MSSNEDIKQVSEEQMVAYWTLVTTNPDTGQLDEFVPSFTVTALKAKKGKGSNPDPSSNNRTAQERI